MMPCDVALCLLAASESAACTHGCNFAFVTAAICSSFKAIAGDVKQIVVGGMRWGGGGWGDGSRGGPGLRHIYFPLRSRGFQERRGAGRERGG